MHLNLQSAFLLNPNPNENKTRPGGGTVDTRRSERRADYRRGSSSLPLVTAEKTNATLQVGRRSLGSHKPDCPVRVRDLQLELAGYANWQSGEVESLVPVGSTPTLVTQ